MGLAYHAAPLCTVASFPQRKRPIKDIDSAAIPCSDSCSAVRLVKRNTSEVILKTCVVCEKQFHKTFLITVFTLKIISKSAVSNLTEVISLCLGMHHGFPH